MKKKIRIIFFLSLLIFILLSSCSQNLESADQLYNIEIDEAGVEESSYCLNPEEEARALSTRASIKYVRIYEHSWYRGAYYFITEPNEYKTLDSIGMNDRVSSVRVYNGAQIYMTEHAAGAGYRMYIFEDVPDLAVYSINDKFSGLLWQPNPTTTSNQGESPGRFAIVYEHSQFRGRPAFIFSDMAKEVIPYPYAPYSFNDRVSSLKLYGGASIQLYEHTNCSGRSISFTTDIRDLVPYRFNDLASSAIVY